MTASLESLRHLPDWPRWLSPEQAAAYVGVSENRFRYEIEQGVWPEAQERGGRRVFDRRLLDAASDRISGIDGAATPGAGLKKDWAGAIGHGKG